MLEFEGLTTSRVLLIRVFLIMYSIYFKMNLSDASELLLLFMCLLHAVLDTPSAVLLLFEEGSDPSSSESSNSS